MTEIVLPNMAAKGRGFVINIGSSAGIRPVPLLSLYSGTKVVSFNPKKYFFMHEKLRYMYIEPVIRTS